MGQCFQLHVPVLTASSFKSKISNKNTTMGENEAINGSGLVELVGIGSCRLADGVLRKEMSWVLHYECDGLEGGDK